MSETSGVVIGADPGGMMDKFGLAALEVKKSAGAWTVLGLKTAVVGSTKAAIAWIENESADKTIRGLGIDTLTEWSTAPGGWRPADKWLRGQPGLKPVSPSVQTPNRMSGSVVIGGASILVEMAARLREDAALVTEAHPKVCYFACTGLKHDWATNRPSMTGWVEGELGQPTNFGLSDDEFDACVAALAALKGLNGAWSTDLHDMPWGDGERVTFAMRTQYFWP